MVKVSLAGVGFQYGNHKVLENISFDAFPGEVTTIIGPNGAGKSTLLKLISGILKPTRGRICLDNKDTIHMSREEIVKIVSYLPQENTIPGILTVYETLLLGRIPYLSLRIKEEDLKAVENVLEDLGLKSFALRYAHQLSGGERQMILIAQALVREPKVLLLDEPVSNLDIRHQLKVLNMIRKITFEKKMTTIIVIHDLNLALRYSENIIIINGGRIVGKGKPRSILTEDLLAYTYGVDVKIYETDGFLNVIPIRPK